MSVETEKRPDIAWLQQRLSEHKKNFETSRGWYRSKARNLAVIGFILGSSTTILIALQQFDWNYKYINIIFSVTALLFSASATVISNLEAFFEPRRLWIRYGSTLNGIKALSDKLEFMLTWDANPSEDAINNIFNELQNILNENNSEWEKTRLKSIERQPDRTDK